MSARPAIAPQDRLGLARAEAAEYIGISATLFDELVKDGRMPPAKAMGARRVWNRLALERAFAALPDAIADGAAPATQPALSVWSNPKL